jgi:hypothetical protein
LDETSRLILVRPVTRLLSSQYLLALLLCGCSETVTYYEADAAGHWRKSVVNRHLGGYRATAATYVINGITFQYHFQAIGGSAEIRGEGSTPLAPGNGSAPSTNCELHSFFVADEFFLAALSAEFTMQVSPQTDSRRDHTGQKIPTIYSSPEADPWWWSTVKSMVTVGSLSLGS